MALSYQITLLPAQHCYQVKLVFCAPTAAVELSLPVWIPGSYMVREFSKQVIAVTAQQAHNECKCKQITKNYWQLDQLQPGQKVEVSYHVYAYEVGIRTAFLDQFRGYFNPTSLCLRLVGHEQQPHYLEFSPLPNGWQIATGLTKVNNLSWYAADYDELIDCPVELGLWQRFEFVSGNIRHYLILSGSIVNFDQQRLLKDMAKICQTQIELWGGIPPYLEYTFILNLAGEVYTGLEHRNSTLLMAPYWSVPNLSATNDEAYHKLLSLISHEFFHTWNVKRVKPQAFIPYNYDQENYTTLLWWFEGVTSYYDDLILYRCGILNQEQYLKLVLTNLNQVYKYAGVTQQSLANSSLTSWIKYYRQDENSPNTLVSYYVKGAIVAMCLDILIRSQSQFSLDDVLRLMFKRWQEHGTGIAEDEIATLITAATGVDLSEFVQQATQTTLSLPLTEILAKVGLNLTQAKAGVMALGQLNPTVPESSTPESSAPILELGVRVEAHGLGLVVKHVYAYTPAAQAGLAAGDILLAIDRVKLTNLERQLSMYSAGAKIELALLRQERLFLLEVELALANTQLYHLQIVDLAQLQLWL